MAKQSTDGIEALEEILGLLKITEEYTSNRNRTIKPVISETSREMSTAPAKYHKIV